MLSHVYSKDGHLAATLFSRKWDKSSCYRGEQISPKIVTLKKVQGVTTITIPETTKTFGLSPDQGWTEFYRSYSSFINQCPRTGKFRSVRSSLKSSLSCSLHTKAWKLAALCSILGDPKHDLQRTTCRTEDIFAGHLSRTGAALLNLCNLWLTKLKYWPILSGGGSNMPASTPHIYISA